MNYVSLENAYPDAFLTPASVFDPEYHLAAEPKISYEDLTKVSGAITSSCGDCDEMSRHMKNCLSCKAKLKKIIHDEIKAQPKPAAVVAAPKMLKAPNYQRRRMRRPIYHACLLSLIFFLLFLFLFSVIISTYYKISITKRTQNEE